MNARRAKTRALLRMERKPTPHGAGYRFWPVRRLVGRYKAMAQCQQLGQYEEVRFITSPALAPFQDLGVP